MGMRLAITQEEVGYLARVSRQRANQALRKLEEAGLLTVEYGAVRVLDLDGLNSTVRPRGGRGRDGGLSDGAARRRRPGAGRLKRLRGGADEARAAIRQAMKRKMTRTGVDINSALFNIAP